MLGLLMALLAPQCQGLDLTLAWNVPPFQPAPYVLRGYQLLVIDPEQNETPYWILSPTPSNWVVQFTVYGLQPSTRYEFKCASLCVSAFDEHFYTLSSFATLEFQTGAIVADDTREPELEITSAPAYTFDGKVELTGTVQDESNVTLTLSGTYDLIDQSFMGTGGPWRADLFLREPGLNQVVVEAIDILGNRMHHTIGITNLAGRDTDEDGLTDNAEVYLTRTDPANPDSDQDGYTDYEEFLKGMDPNDPRDSHKIEQVRFEASTGLLTFTCRAQTNHWYRLQYSDDFQRWTGLIDLPSENSRSLVFQVTAPEKFPRFYRLQVNP